MSHLNYTTKSKKGQHLNYEERQKIEILLKAGHKPEEIGLLLGGRSKRTIQREIALGTVELLNSDLTYRREYSADVAQSKRDFNNTAKGPRLTNDALPAKKIGKKRKYHHVRAAYHQKGKSIEERPTDAENKEIFGHWELDTVVGKQGTKAALMVMTERSKGIEIIRKIESKSQQCIVRELNRLERKLGAKKFRETFKTITCDNGCENFDFEGMERSVLTNIPRTQVFYAHPYSAWERGANECANKLIRRFIPKGSDISKYSKKFIRYIQHWMNSYPWKKLGWLSSYEASLSLNPLPILW